MHPAHYDAFFLLLLQSLHLWSIFCCFCIASKISIIILDFHDFLCNILLFVLQLEKKYLKQMNIYGKRDQQLQLGSRYFFQINKTDLLILFTFFLYINEQLYFMIKIYILLEFFMFTDHNFYVSFLMSWL